MIIIALGANLPHPVFGPPEATLMQALAELSRTGLTVVRRSRFYRTAPVPASSQPWFVNAVAAVETRHGPIEALAKLQEIEVKFGRARKVVNEARVLDLDLIDYDGLVRPGPEPPILPHARASERAFVLLPLADIDPAWRHPASGASLAELIARLPADQSGVAFEPSPSPGMP